MSRWIGRWLMAVGFIHVIFGAVAFTEPLLGIVRDGVWNAVDGHPGRPLAFWFVFSGLITILFGSVTDWVERRGGEFPAHLGWGLLILVTLAIVTMPLGGGWLLLPPAIGAFLKSLRPAGDESAAA